MASRQAAAAHGNALYNMQSEATRAKAIGGMSHVFAMATGNMTDMIFTGVFERFPELQVCWIETGVGWIPHFLECIDDRWWRNRVWGDLPLSEPPSYYWYRNNAASFIIDHTGVEVRHRAGVDNIMWSSDYPHHGNDWPYSRRTIEDMMGSIAEDEKARIAGGNAARIWGVEL
jgi:predicted TIM-barrel fold metal-dependent hydrolase